MQHRRSCSSDGKEEGGGGCRDLTGTCSIRHNCSVSHWVNIFLFPSHSTYIYTVYIYSSIYYLFHKLVSPLLTLPGRRVSSLPSPPQHVLQQKHAGSLKKQHRDTAAGVCRPKKHPFSTHQPHRTQAVARFTESKDSVSSLLSQRHL